MCQELEPERSRTRIQGHMCLDSKPPFFPWNCIASLGEECLPQTFSFIFILKIFPFAFQKFFEYKVRAVNYVHQVVVMRLQDIWIVVVFKDR